MARKPRRILVVEDDAEVAAVLSEMLHRSGYQVLTARSGVEAIVALTSPAPELPDAILLDIGLPLSSGVTVLDFVRNIMSSKLPVIVLTASANADQEQELRKLGISRYLRKPASLEQVLSAISEALTSRKRH